MDIGEPARNVPALTGMSSCCSIAKGCKGAGAVAKDTGIPVITGVLDQGGAELEWGYHLKGVSLEFGDVIEELVDFHPLLEVCQHLHVRAVYVLSNAFRHPLKL